MKEIGGYFEIEKLIDKPFHNNCLKINSGRSALKYLIKAKNITKIHIPYYLCNSVKDYIVSTGVEIKYYHVNEKFQINDESIDVLDYIYVVNYYGQLTEKYINKIRDKYKNVIFDNTHSFFSSPPLGMDVIYSCRKFFGVPDGAYLYTDTIPNEVLVKNKVLNSINHIIGRSENNASDFYRDYIKSDEAFENTPVREMSLYSETILGAIDYNRVKDIRKDNFNFLHSKFKKINKLEIYTTIIPYCYPLMIENAIEIRRKLIDEKIYVPILWNDALEFLNESDIEYQLIEKILPLPCDQRYTKKDLQRIIEVILSED